VILSAAEDSLTLWDLRKWPEMFEGLASCLTSGCSAPLKHDSARCPTQSQI